MENAKRAVRAYLVIVMTVARGTQGEEYISERVGHYAELIDKSRNESEISDHLDQFLKEVRTYLKSG